MRLFSAAAAIRILVLGAILGLGLVWGCQHMIKMPGKSHLDPLPPLTPADTSLRDALRRHVEKLAIEIGERNSRHPSKLAEASRYIEATLAATGRPVARQEYEIAGATFVNLALELPAASPEHGTLVIGAHYDSAPGTPGANDNASGVAGLLELARSLSTKDLPAPVRLVAFTNEEPPYFKSGEMGSLVYANGCRDRGERIIGMISLETIGYFTDQARSQHYPFPFGAFYPSTGNFIAFVSNLGSRRFLHRTIDAFRREARFPSEGGALPSLLPGVGWSDHWSFWKAGYPALMVTDTAPFRYPFYHSPADTPDKIDFDRMARVIAGMERTVLSLLGDR